MKDTISQEQTRSKTHWKKLTNTTYFGSWDIPEGKRLKVTIEAVKKETVIGQGGEKDECVVAHLHNQKPLILNATNCKTITKITGSPYIEDWAGVSILLTVQKVRAFGEWVDAVRVAPVKVEKPTIEPNTERYSKAVAALKNGDCTLEYIQSHYSIAPETLEKLKGEINAQ